MLCLRYRLHREEIKTRRDFVMNEKKNIEMTRNDKYMTKQKQKRLDNYQIGQKLGTQRHPPEVNRSGPQFVAGRNKTNKYNTTLRSIPLA